MKIKGNDYKIKYTLRAMFIFEQIKGSAFAINTITDEFIYLYALLLANNSDMELTFDELIDELDNNPELIQEFRKSLIKENEKQSVFAPNEGDVDSKKKS